MAALCFCISDLNAGELEGQKKLGNASLIKHQNVIQCSILNHLIGFYNNINFL